MRKFFILLFFSTTLSSFAHSEIDSLWAIYQSEDIEDSLRFDALYERINLEPTVDSTLKYTRLLEIETKSLNSHYWQYQVLRFKSWVASAINQIDSCILFSHDALEVAQNSGNNLLIASANAALGYYYFHRTEKYDTAKYYLQKAIELRLLEKENSNLDKEQSSALILSYLSLANLERYHNKNFTATLRLLKSASNIANDIGDFDKLSEIQATIGFMYNNINDYPKAIDAQLLALHYNSQEENGLLRISQEIMLSYYYSENFQYNRTDSLLYITRQKLNKNPVEQGSFPYNKINYEWHLVNATSKKARDISSEADSSYHQSLKFAEKTKDSTLIASALSNLGAFYVYQKDFPKAMSYSFKAYTFHKKHCPLSCLSKDARALYQSYAELGNYEQALKFYEEYVLLKDSIANEENQRALLDQEYKFAYEKKSFADSLKFAKAQEVKDLELKKQEAQLSSQRLGLVASGGGLLLLVALAFSVHRGKKKSDELLLNILPEETAKELKANGRAQSKAIKETTVLFTDFEGFTQMAESISPTQLVEDINTCFSAFDHIMDKYNVEKIKTIGDAYMAAGGLPTPNSTHVKDVTLAALEIAEFMENWIANKSEKGEPYFNIRIGLHTGPVVAGIVGVKKFQYDIWGDTVNTASRMESNGQAGKVNISSETYALVKDEPEFSFERRDKTKVKGKGEMKMYFVKRKESQNNHAKA